MNESNEIDMYKTFTPKVDPNARKWFVVDLTTAPMGRIAVKVADILRGKNKPIFTPHLDTGDNVIAINASGMTFTQDKLDQSKYYRYSGYPGGLRETTRGEMMAKHPERVFELAVKRMLPKNRLGRKMFKKLHVYPTSEHPHKAQKPEVLKLF